MFWHANSEKNYLPNPSHAFSYSIYNLRHRGTSVDLPMHSYTMWNYYNHMQGSNDNLFSENWYVLYCNQSVFQKVSS